MSVGVATEVPVRTSELTKAYGRRVAVDSLSFDVPAGSVFGFLGPNGAGKTTTIRHRVYLSATTSWRGC